MKFYEDVRVKIPAILHRTRLGDTCLSLKNLDRRKTAMGRITIYHVQQSRIALP